MTEEAKEARRAYYRKWAREHPEKIRAYHRRHWEKVAQQIAEEGKSPIFYHKDGKEVNTE